MSRHDPATGADATANHRRALLDVLRCLADLDDQLACERSVEIAGVHAELVCMWFDDLHPSVADARLAESFSPHEREILATFHRAYEARLPSLPQRPHGVAGLHACPAWHEVVALAADAVRALRLHGGGRAARSAATNGARDPHHPGCALEGPRGVSDHTAGVAPVRGS